MNQKNTETLYKHLLNAAFIAALPDFKKQELWQEASKINPEHPIVPFFKQITDGIPGVRALFDELQKEQ
ncbi:MAG: hypothetical protein LBU19_10585 [Treponema sp.]|jgi:hypothetical protein|nr:hypothetical protein [Treponema sp.]